MRKVRIGLALGGGGPKGLAHIGVLKVLNKYKIPIDYIAGTSAGSIVGSFYALRQNINEVENFFLNKGWFETIGVALDPSLNQGLLQGKKIQELLEKYLGKNEFGQLQIPFKAITTNLVDGNTVILDKGNLVTAIIASSSIPMLFRPVNIEGKILVDGGVTSPVPVDTVRKMGSDLVIAVNLYNHAIDGQINEKDNFFKIGLHTINLMTHKISYLETQKADLIVYPMTKKIVWKSLLNQKEKIAAIAEGEKAMETIMPELRRLIAKKQHEGIWEKAKSWFKNLLDH